MKRALIAVLLIAVPTAVRADCAGDVSALRARLAREKDPQIVAAVRKPLQQAQKQLKGSESECRNAVTRAYRAFNEPAATPVDIKEPYSARRPNTSYTPLNARPAQPLNATK